jgi:hypothetical protein
VCSDPHPGIDQMVTTGGNYWRARTIHDVFIDPRLSASSIIAIARSFCPPYPGARLIVGSSDIRIPEGWSLEDVHLTTPGRDDRNMVG